MESEATNAKRSEDLTINEVDFSYDKQDDPILLDRLSII